MKKIMHFGKALSPAEQKSITGGGGISGPGGGMFVMVQCSNGVAVCIYCETTDDCAANAEKACAAIGGSES